MPGNKLGPPLPYLFDEVFALRVEEAQDGSLYRVLQTSRDIMYEAKDRSGALDLYEPPKLHHIYKKIYGEEIEFSGGLKVPTVKEEEEGEEAAAEVAEEPIEEASGGEVEEEEEAGEEAAQEAEVERIFWVNSDELTTGYCESEEGFERLVSEGNVERAEQEDYEEALESGYTEVIPTN